MRCSEFRGTFSLYLKLLWYMFALCCHLQMGCFQKSTRLQYSVCYLILPWLLDLSSTVLDYCLFPKLVLTDLFASKLQILPTVCGDDVLWVQTAKVQKILSLQNFYSFTHRIKGLFFDHILT